MSDRISVNEGVTFYVQSTGICEDIDVEPSIDTVIFPALKGISFYVNLPTACLR